VVLFDVLAEGERDLRTAPLAERRGVLEQLLRDAGSDPRLLLTPATRDRDTAADWFARFEGAGLDGVVAKRLETTYQPGVRAMVKVKHARTADCAVAGFRWHKDGRGTEVGSLLLGLYDDGGRLQHAGVCASFSAAFRRELARELAPLREGAEEGHPWGDWADWARVGAAPDRRVPGASSRWNRGKDLSWEPVRVERVCEVAYDHLQGDRFRHGTHFVRWRPDRSPRQCTYAQLEETPAYELSRIFGEAPTHGS